MPRHYTLLYGVYLLRYWLWSTSSASIRNTLGPFNVHSLPTMNRNISIKIMFQDIHNELFIVSMHVCGAILSLENIK